jgi:hypothetical protein
MTSTAETSRARIAEARWVAGQVKRSEIRLKAAGFAYRQGVSTIS